MPVTVPDELRAEIAAALLAHVRGLRDAHRDYGGPPPAITDFIMLIRELRAASVDGNRTVTGPHKPLLSTAEAAQRLNITARRVRQLAETGALPAHRVGRTWVILEEHCVPARVATAASRR